MSSTTADNKKVELKTTAEPTTTSDNKETEDNYCPYDSPGEQAYYQGVGIRGSSYERDNYPDEYYDDYDGYGYDDEGYMVSLGFSSAPDDPYQ